MTRFMGKVQEQENGCWLWTGVRMGRAPHQYGAFRPGTLPNGRKVAAHRWLYEQRVGPIPDGLELDHLCRVKLCVNPAHMEPVTEAENHRRKRLKRCRAGEHDLTLPENIRWDGQGRRRGCLACWKRHQANRRS